MSEIYYETSFGAGKWHPEDWYLVKNPTHDYLLNWKQEKDCIVNPTPNVSDEEIREKYCGDVYVGSILKKKFPGDILVTVNTSFDYKYAPLVILAPEIELTDSPEVCRLKNHYEVVFYDNGYNVWYVFQKEDGSWTVRNCATMRGTYLNKTRYQFQVKLNYTEFGCKIYCTGPDREFGFLEPWLPKNCYVGLAACEGRNRFYSFKIEEGNGEQYI